MHIRTRMNSVALTVGILCCTALPVLSQGIETPTLQQTLTSWELNPSTPRTTAAVSLDGQRLFLIAVPDAGDSLPLQRRLKEINNNLQRVIREGIDPDRLEVAIETDESSNQPVIYINNFYIMTITSLDAQVQGVSPKLWSQEVKDILTKALVEHYTERQPSYLLPQGAKALGVLIGMAVLSLFLQRWSREIESRRSVFESKLAALLQQEMESEAAESQIEEKALLQRDISGLAAQQRLSYLGQAIIWSGGFLWGFGLFPFTRGLQAATIYFVRGTVFRLLCIALALAILGRFSDHMVDRFFFTLRQGRWWDGHQTTPRFRKRVDTFSNIAKGLANTTLLLIGSIVGLGVLGVSVGPLLASLGFIGLGISLAGQDLIKDVINGVFILLEDQYAEGDVIAVDGRAGQVERLNLRITQLRNTEGTLITIPNRAIGAVENLSNGWARVDMSVDVAYDTDLDYAMTVMVDVANDLSMEKGWRHKVLAPPELQGVDNFGDNSISIRIWIRVQPLTQWEVAREYRRRLKHAFDRVGISIPFPQRELWFRNELPISSAVKGKGNSQVPVSAPIP